MNSTFLIIISLQHDEEKCLYFNQIIFSHRIHSLKYPRSTTLGPKDIGIRKLKFVAKTPFLSKLFIFSIFKFMISGISELCILCISILFLTSLIFVFCVLWTSELFKFLIFKFVIFWMSGRCMLCILHSMNICLSYLSFWYLSLWYLGCLDSISKDLLFKRILVCQVSSVICSQLINYSGTNNNNNNKIFIVKQIVHWWKIYLMKLTVIARVWNIMGSYFHNYSVYFGQRLEF